MLLSTFLSSRARPILVMHDKARSQYVEYVHESHFVCQLLRIKLDSVKCRQYIIVLNSESP